jgi:hypothetical protein
MYSYSMIKKIIVNPDYFTWNVDRQYEMICKKILAKHVIRDNKISYEIYTADGAGIQFLIESSGQELHITKEEMISVLTNIKKSHEFSTKDLSKMVEKKQSAVLTFLTVSDVLY